MGMLRRIRKWRLPSLRHDSFARSYFTVQCRPVKIQIHVAANFLPGRGEIGFPSRKELAQRGSEFHCSWMRAIGPGDSPLPQ